MLNKKERGAENWSLPIVYERAKNKGKKLCEEWMLAYHEMGRISFLDRERRNSLRTIRSPFWANKLYKKGLSCDKNSAFYFFWDLLYYGDLLWIIIAGTYRLYNRLWIKRNSWRIVYIQARTWLVLEHPRQATGTFSDIGSAEPIVLVIFNPKSIR